MSQWPGIDSIASQVNAGEATAASFVERSLQLIAENAEFEAVVATLGEQARQRAQEIDQLVASGKPAGRLAGVPFIAKDNFLVFGGDTRAASNILKGFQAPYQASVINKLEAEGAICVAKANLDAFAHGSSTENSDFGVTKNPHDKTRVPGGSSGGSAAAVVLGLAPFALGTDTGGSIRHPASLTGCVGYKPTYGLVSRSGVIAMASSTDTIGFLTGNVDDLALLVDVTAGTDPLDSTTIARDNTPYTQLDADVKGKTFGLVKEWLGEGIDSEVKNIIEGAVARLKAAGGRVEEVSLPSLPLALAVYYIVVPAEISSNLSRYDGQRYGHHDASASELESSYLSARGQGFGSEAKRRIMIGTYVLSSGYYDAYYNKAQTVRTKLIKEFQNAFRSVDFLIGPVAPNVAFEIGKNTTDPL
ncbi:aspartyl/glutamyl-tRNA amidotransferase subunit A, partial [Candidatus Saccharibacteria bacterium]|nr:aspartyl/glutamyl-tRNA amidotransferase subunit A [Candidatus Saccharibacteria bacterium]